VDPRPETVEGGEIKIRITPQLVHDIFDEYPVVAKAYTDNVPNKVCGSVLLSAFSQFVELQYEVVGGGVLETIFPVQTLQRTPSFNTVFCDTTCSQG
jgi:hypothetical protein